MDDVQAAVVTEAVGYLRNGVSVNLVGPRLSGSSRIARLTAQELRAAGLTVLAVAGIGVLNDRPLAALALGGIDVPAGNAAFAITEAVSALSKHLPAGRSVIMVDHADDLDAVSAGAITAVRAGQPVPALLVSRPTAPVHAPGRWLNSAFQPGVRIDVEALSFDQVNTLVHGMLSGAVDSAMIARIVTLSGGLRGLVSAIVETGRWTGGIVLDGLLWRARGDLWNNRLVSPINALLEDLADDELDALVRLSVLGAIPDGKARQVVPDRMLSRLEACGLLRVLGSASEHLVGVFPPIVGVHLRRCSAVTSLAMLDAERAAVSGSSAFVATRARTDPGIRNVRISDHWQRQIRMLRSVWLADPRVANALPLLDALNESSAGPDALGEVLCDTSLIGADQHEEARFTIWRAASRALLDGDIVGACSLLAEQRALAPAAGARLRAAEARLLLHVGPLPDPDIFAASCGESDSPDAECLAVMRVAILLAAGRTKDALAALPERCPLDAESGFIYRVLDGLVRVLNGEFDAGVQRALSAMAGSETGCRLSELHAHTYVAALGLTFGGRLDELGLLIDPMLSLEPTTLFSEHYRVGVLGLASLAADWRGRSEGMWSLATQAEAAGRRQGPYPGMTHAVTPLLFDGDRGDLDAAGRRVWSAVAERLDKGFVAAAITLAVTAVEIQPDADAALAVADCVHRSESPFLAALGCYVAAAGSRDAEALADSIVELSALGARLHAVKASVTRAVVLRSEGAIAESVRQSEAAWAMAGALGHGYRGLFRRLGAAVGLTGREAEIARLGADGLSAAELASTLGLQARTVENYFSSAYGKVGCDNRDDFMRAVSTWAYLG